MSQAAPVFDRIRIIPRPSDFLNRNVGSSGEIFYNRETNSLRVYSGKDTGGFEVAKSDLSNIDNTAFLDKAVEAGVSGAGGGISLTDLSVTDNSDSGASLTYDNTTGVFTFEYTPPTIPTTLTDLGITDGDPNQVLTTDGSGTFSFTTIVGGGGGELNQNAFSSIEIAGQNTVEADSTTDTLTLIAGSNITLTTNDTNDSITIASSSSFGGLTDISALGLTIDKIYDSAVTRYQVDNNSTSAYLFSPHYTGDNPTIFAIAGLTIAFDLSGISGHPFEIQDALGDPYNTGLVHVATDGTVTTGTNAQGKDSGTLYWYIDEEDGGTYRYQCQNHAAMVGNITVKRLSLL